MASHSTRRRQVVVPFGGRWDMRTSSLRGGKGANLAEMQALGLPVPPGFTITTTVARAMMQNRKLPRRLETQLRWNIKALEKSTGRKFGDVNNPLLLSVRSGAQVSMPGMMDTILNLGMNEAVVEVMTEAGDGAFALDCWHRFATMYRSVVDVDSVPQDPWEQLLSSIIAVIKSWESKRAVAYREVHSIPHTLGTAVNVQAMVFGNRSEKSSGTGVVFSRDPNTGKPGLYGEFLQGVQGEDLVSGASTPMPIAFLADWNQHIYDELVAQIKTLEKHFDTIVDVEFTVEEGVLWILQCRPAKLSLQARATCVVHRVWAKQCTRLDAIRALTSAEVDALNTRPSLLLEESPDLSMRILGEGLAASPGAAHGEVAWTSEEATAMKAQGKKVILVRDETDPKDLPGMLASVAIITAHGGATCHAAVVARQLGIPAVVGVGQSILFKKGEINLPQLPTEISVCGTSGIVYAGLLPLTTPTHPKEVNIFLKWVREQGWPVPRINFAAVEQRLNVHNLIVDTYLLESMAHNAKGTRLEEEINAFRHGFLVRIAEHFACYLAIAVASELKHLHAEAKNVQSEDIAVLKQKYGFDSFSEMCGRIVEILKPMTVEQQVEFFKLAHKIFQHGTWSHAYGGPSWAVIANAAVLFLTGVMDHSLFVDHVFDLRHNTGTAFDKHRMLNQRTEDDCNNVEELLDMKRYATDLSAMFRAFKDRSSSWGIKFSVDGKQVRTPWHRFSASREVLALWQKGVQAHLWKE